MAPVIELVDVSKRYALEGVAVVALDRLSLKIEEGTVTGIVGRSGSGKSTLLNILGGLDRPTTGEVIVAGRTLSRRTSDELAAYRREAIGFVFQSFHLIPHMTALENVTLALALAGRGPLERRRRAFELLERVGLGARAKHRPRQMSGGEQQRVALARALANDPPVLLADEPTGSLDSRTADDVMNLLLKTAGELKRTVVLVTHEREMARRYCDRMIELGDGRVLHDRMRPFTAEGDAPQAVPEAAKPGEAAKPEAAA